MQQNRLSISKSILLPILCAVYPVIFLYSHNVAIDQASSMILPLIYVIILACILFGLFYLFQRSLPKASLSALVMLFLFNTYGILFDRLIKINLIEIEHYTLLPLLILSGVYLAFFLSKLSTENAQKLQNILLIVFAFLVVYNLATAIPVEIQKGQARQPVKAAQAAGQASQAYPDIYFLVFDEYAGFDAMKKYWKYDEINQFEDSLRAKGFFIAEHSHSRTHDTLHEVASRLNMKVYPGSTAQSSAEYSTLFNAIADNKVMQTLKAYGYTTVVFDGPSYLYKNKTPITADYNLQSRKTTHEDRAITPDEFFSLYVGQTMVRAFPQIYNSALTGDNESIKMIFYTLDKTADLKEIPTPKFVYMHVMLPHLPISFDSNGNLEDLKYREDWSYYLGQHQYATKRAEELVTQILKNASPGRPPIIVLQSDHGARNEEPNSSDGKPLQNYDEKYKTSIMNALLLPGFDTSTLTQDMDPIYTFEIILNHYFNAKVKVDLSTSDQ